MIARITIKRTGKVFRIEPAKIYAGGALCQSVGGDFCALYHGNCGGGGKIERNLYCCQDPHIVFVEEKQ